MAKSIVVVGAGYVGLPLAIMLAKSGHKVTCVDIRGSVVDSINSGNSSASEKEINQAFKEAKNNLSAQKMPCQSDVFIISVPTPLEYNHADLSHVIDATNSIVPYLQKGNLVILESTVPPRTCQRVLAPILEKSKLKVGEDIYLCHCPERSIPNHMLKEIVENDRVIGGVTPKSAELAKEIYGSFVKGNIFLTDDVTAEFVKLMENTYRDVNIALANEFAVVAEEIKVDIIQAIKLANAHPRVYIHRPGIGVGGHCIPIVPWFIRQIDPINTMLIATARRINDSTPCRIAKKIDKAVSGISEPQVVILGIAYKPDTDDTRNSPTDVIVKELQSFGIKVRTYDPLVKGYEYESISSIAQGKDCLAILVEHKVIKDEYKRFEKDIKKVMRHPIVMRFYQ